MSLSLIHIYHEGIDHLQGALCGHEAAAHRLQDREDHLPPVSYTHLLAGKSRLGFADKSGDDIIHGHHHAGDLKLGGLVHLVLNGVGDAAGSGGNVQTLSLIHIFC